MTDDSSREFYREFYGLLNDKDREQQEQRTAVERLAVAEAKLAEVRAIATEMRYRRAAPAITAYGAALLAALDGADPKDQT